MGDPVSGEAFFSSVGCNICHSPMGNGVFGSGLSLLDVNNLQKTTLDNLATYINDNMPTNSGSFSSSDCVGACATDVAAYLKTFVNGSGSSSSGNSSSSSSSSSSGSTGGVIYAVNIGGGDVTDSTGQLYEAEKFVRATVGDQSATADAIGGTDDDELYQTQRWGMFTMELPVTDGDYDVTIKTAEQYWDAAGSRSMSVTAEGVTIAQDLDIYGTVGHDVALDLSESNIPVTDGSLTIQFSASTDQATASAVLVTSDNGGIGEPPPAPSTERDGVFFDAISCGDDMPGPSYEVMGPNEQSTWGWSHVITSPGEFNTLRNSDRSVYDISSERFAPDSSCGGEDTYQAVFVRKYHVPDHRHANGLGITANDEVLADRPSLNDVQAIVMDLKLNSSSFIPDASAHNFFHSGLAAFQISLQDFGFQKLVQIDQDLYFDQWIRLTIPVNLSGDMGILRIQPETTNDGWSGQGELLMEVDVSIHRIEFLLR